MVKSRYYTFCLLILTIIIPLYHCFIDNSGLQMRAQKLHEYGDRLSSIEDDTGLYNFGRHSPVAPAHAKESESIEAVNNEEDRNAEHESEEHEETTAKKLADSHSHNEDATFTTKCTTDKDIKIGNYKPESSEEGKHDKEEESEEGGEVLKKETSNDGETVTKVYIPPKRAKLPDHYVDDI